MDTLRQIVVATHTVEFSKLDFKNTRSKRIEMGTPIDPSLKKLSFEQFLDAYFGDMINRLVDVFPEAGGWSLQHELDSIGETLWEHCLNARPKGRPREKSF